MCLHTTLTEFFLNCHCLLRLAFYIAWSTVWWNRLKKNVSAFAKSLWMLTSCCFYPFFLLLDHLLFLLLFLLLNSLLFFLLMLLLYFCLLINHVNQPIVFVFGTFVYYFRNTISIFVTICYTRIYIHMSAFLPILETLLKRAFWYRQQLLFRFFFYLLNRSKTLSFHRCLQFWEEEKISGGQAWWIRWLRHEYGFVFGQKLTHKHLCVS